MAFNATPIIGLRFDWRGSRIVPDINARLARGLLMAGAELSNEIKATLSRQGRINFGGANARRKPGQLFLHTQDRKALTRALSAQRFAGPRDRASVDRSTGRVYGLRLNQGGRWGQQSGGTNVFGRRLDPTIGVQARFRGARLLGLVTRSDPGQPPHTQTGRLRNSIGFASVGALKVRVGTNVKYAPWLEFGTRGGKIIRAKGKSLYDPVTRTFFGKTVRQGRIKPRPFFAPTVRRVGPRLLQIMRAVT